MVRISAHAVLNMPADKYWRVRLTPQFFDIENQILRNESKLVLEQSVTESGQILTQRVATKPDLSQVPEVLMRLGPPGGLVFTDNITFDYSDPQTPYAYTCFTDPSILGDRCSVRSRVRCYPNPDNKTCKQEIILDITVNVWGIGSLVENVVANAIAQGYHQLPAMVDLYNDLYGHQTRSRRNSRERMIRCTSNEDDALSVSSTASDTFYDAYSDMDGDSGYQSLVLGGDFTSTHPSGAIIGGRSPSDMEKALGDLETPVRNAWWKRIFCGWSFSFCGGCWSRLFCRRRRAACPDDDCDDMGDYSALPAQETL